MSLDLTMFRCLFWKTKTLKIFFVVKTVQVTLFQINPYKAFKFQKEHKSTIKHVL